MKNFVVQSGAMLYIIECGLRPYKIMEVSVMRYGESFDMHVCFYGDHVTVENPDYKVSFDITPDCGISELSELLKIACRTLISMENAYLQEGHV